MLANLAAGGFAARCCAWRPKALAVRPRHISHIDELATVRNCHLRAAFADVAIVAKLGNWVRAQ